MTAERLRILGGFSTHGLVFLGTDDILGVYKKYIYTVTHAEGQTNLHRGREIDWQIQTDK